jgi:hypothetical protein
VTAVTVPNHGAHHDPDDRIGKATDPRLTRTLMLRFLGHQAARVDHREEGRNSVISNGKREKP